MAASLTHALAGKPIRVGTQNPAKLGAVRAALISLAGADGSELFIQGIATASEVPDQPVGWDEIMIGARNRARAALASGPGVLAFGIEDGLVELPGAGGAVFNIGCAWVTDGSREGKGFSSGFAYPPAAVRPAFRDREPVGDLFDALWQAHRPVVDGQPGSGGGQPSGRQGGNIGQLTQGRLDRSAYGAQAILCALVPFLHVDLYD